MNGPDHNDARKDYAMKLDICREKLATELKNFLHHASHARTAGGVGEKEQQQREEMEHLINEKGFVLLSLMKSYSNII